MVGVSDTGCSEGGPGSSPSSWRSPSRLSVGSHGTRRNRIGAFERSPWWQMEEKASGRELVQRLGVGQEGAFPHSVLGMCYLLSMCETIAVSISCRSEHKVWSPLVTEEGRRHPYKMNLASEPQVSTRTPTAQASLLWTRLSTLPFLLARRAWRSGSRESPPCPVLGPGACSALPVRELREERAGNPQAVTPWAGLEAGGGKAIREAGRAFLCGMGWWDHVK